MFVKLFSQILDSSIADDRKLRHFFTDLLLCADGEGYVMMTEAALARRIGATLEEVQWGISELLKPDKRSKTPDNEGRRIVKVEGSGYGWHILNYTHYRSMKDADQLREAVKIRVQRHRAKKAGKLMAVGGNADVTLCNASNAMQRKNAETEEEAKADTPVVPKGTVRARKVNAAVDDESWLKSLETDATYAGIDIRRELGKCQRWCSEKRQQPSRMRFVNWLNRADRNIAIPGTIQPRAPKHPAYSAASTTAGMTDEEIKQF